MKRRIPVEVSFRLSKAARVVSPMVANTETRIKTSTQLLLLTKSYSALMCSTFPPYRVYGWCTSRPFILWLTYGMWGQPVSCCEGGNRQRAHPGQKMLTQSLSICRFAGVGATGHNCRISLACSSNHSFLACFKWAGTLYTVGHTHTELPVSLFVKTEWCKSLN